MQLKFQLVVSSVLVFFLSAPAYSRNIEPVFQQLKTSSEKYQIVGTVCEQVARLELELQYPADEYSVENGIAYTQGGQTLGELDVVVFRRNDHKVILIGEVKCWHDLHGAQVKARHQRENFIFHLKKGGRGIDFYKTMDPKVHYSPRQFDQIPPFILISQDEGRYAGFDLALPYSLDELMELREMLLHCQDIGECSTPKH